MTSAVHRWTEKTAPCLSAAEQLSLTEPCHLYVCALSAFLSFFMLLLLACRGPWGVFKGPPANQEYIWLWFSSWEDIHSRLSWWWASFMGKNDWMEQNSEVEGDGYFESSLYQYVFVCDCNMDFFLNSQRSLEIHDLLFKVRKLTYDYLKRLHSS